MSEVDGSWREGVQGVKKFYSEVNVVSGGLEGTYWATVALCVPGPSLLVDPIIEYFVH